jgi:hypothetical protein
VIAAAIVSIVSWSVVILFGRLMALNAFGCESLQAGTLGYAFAECAIDIGEVDAEIDEGGEPSPDDPPADGTGG